MIAYALAFTVYLPLVSAPPVQRIPVRVVYVESSGEAFTPEHRAQASRQVKRGLAYWNELAATSPRLEVVSEATVTIADPFAWWGWLREYEQSGVYTLAIVANARGARCVNLGGGYCGYGYAIPGGRAAYVTSTYGDWPQHVGMTTAHEFGHLLWSLPDGGRERAEHGPSIMNFPDLAFDSWIIHARDYEETRRQPRQP